jgi:hypothetical protein
LTLGVALLIAAKILGVAFSARLFAIACPKMLQVRSFAWLYGHVVRLLALGYAYLEAIPAWATVKAFMRHIGHVAHAVFRTAWKFLRARDGATYAKTLSEALRGHHPGGSASIRCLRFLHIVACQPLADFLTCQILDNADLRLGQLASHNGRGERN